MERHGINYSEFLDPGSYPILCLLLLGFWALVFVKRPMLALAFICVQPYFLWAVGTNFGASFYLAYLAVGIIAWKFRKRIFSRQAPSYGPILIFSMILVFWSVISPLLYPIRDGLFSGYSLSRINLVGSLLPLLLIPRILRNKKDVEYFIQSFIGLLIFLIMIFSLCSLVLLVSGQRTITTLTGTRILGVLPHSWEAALLFIGLAFVHSMGWMPSRRLIPLVLISIFGLLLSNSRTKVFATLFCSAYIVLPYLRRFVFPAMALCSVLFIGMLALPDNIKKQGWEIIEKRIDQTTSDDIEESTSGRSVLYTQAYESFRSSPWIGVGEGYAITPGLRYGKMVRQSPHSYYVGVLAQQGLIGAGIFLLIIAITINLIWQVRRICSTSTRDASIARFLVAVVIYGLFCMVLKASWGSTFWSLALLQVFYNVSTQNNFAHAYKMVRGMLPNRFLIRKPAL